MPFSLSYRRPAYVPPTVGTVMSGDEKDRIIAESLASGHSARSVSIPEALSLDNIINGNVCPPCTSRDFVNYLKYVEHAAENLQFYLWYRDYMKRFEELPEHEQYLSPKWPLIQPKASDSPVNPPLRHSKLSPEVAAIFKGTDFEDVAGTIAAQSQERVNPFDTPPQTPASHSTGSDSFFGARSISDFEAPPDAEEHAARAGTAIKNAGQKWQPFTIQPFREEISRIIAIYIAEGSPRQLNLSSRERKTVLRGLTQTTHPTAFRCAIANIEWSLRCQAHPNFIRWTICNGNRPRVIFARGLGAFAIIAGLATGVLMTLSSAGRAWRVMALIGLIVGISTFIAAWKGMCVVLHGLHHRHLRPWELFSDENFDGDDDDLKKIDSRRNSLADVKNSYEDEPWVAKYDKRNLIRKVFDREVWIEEPALRQIQDTIFLQSVLGAFIISSLIVGMFVSVPKGGMY